MSQIITYEYLFKYILIGDSGVGKSSIIEQIVNQRFNAQYSVTLGVEFATKMMKVQDRSIKLQIWDTSGQESFLSITRSYYKSAAGAILVYDITKRESFNNIQKWLGEVKSNAQQQITAILVGNKSDLDKNRSVQFEEGQKFADENNLIFLETSAKTGGNIEQIFYNSASEILNKIKNNEIDLSSESTGIRVGKVKSSLQISNEKSPQPGNTTLSQKQGQNTEEKRCC